MERICEHLEIPEITRCEYCSAYLTCPLHDHMLILVRQVRRNWEDVELIDDEDPIDGYDYTEGDIGQDGII